MKKLLVLPLAVLACVSCKDEVVNDNSEVVLSKRTICRNVDNEALGLKAVSYKPDNMHYSLWKKGQTINVGFYNGTWEQRHEFMNCCFDWMAHANVYFNELSVPGNADIRVKFENGYGEGASVVGANAQYDKTVPSMHLYVNQLAPTDTMFRLVVRHELGHVLGLAHEHQHPKATIKFDKNKVMKDYGFTEEEYNDNIVKLDAYLTDYTNEYDPNSIMHYEFQPKYTGGKYYHSNSNISAKDKEHIGKLYSMDGTQRIYTFYLNNHHLHSTATNNLTTYRNVLQNTLGRIESSSKAGTAPIYIYYNSITKDNLYTKTKTEVTNGKNGWSYKGVLGYGYTSSGTGRIPVYRFYSATKNAHMLSTNKYASAGGGGYVLEGLLFYVNK